MKEVVVYFVNGRMVKLPHNKIRFERLGEAVDEMYEPALADGVAVINWDNVCFAREWQEPEDEE